MRSPAIAPAHTVDLDHRAYFLRSAPSQSLVVAVAREGRISLIGPGFKVIRAMDLRRGELADAALHPSRPVLAVVEQRSGNLAVVGFDGSVQFEQTPERDARFSACHFGTSGHDLWFAKSLAKANAVRVELRNASDASLVAAIEIPDPYGESSCSFFRTERADAVALWLAAGQDGQQVYWVRKHEERIRCDVESQLADTTPPFFEPEADRYLVVDAADQRIRLLRFPGVPVGECRWRGDADSGFDYSLCFLSDSLALASVREGRTFLLDLDSMALSKEVVILGHEPRPAEELYPTLVGDKQLCTDVSYFERVGASVLFATRRDRGSAVQGWKDRLLVVPIAALTSG